MSTSTKYTPEEAILIGRAGIIAGVLGVISAVSPAVDMAENGVHACNLFSFGISVFGFLPFAAVCIINLENSWKEDKNNTSLARIFVFSIVATLVTALLFVPLIFTGARVFGVIIIGISVCVACWQWPRLPKEAVDTFNDKQKDLVPEQENDGN